jgi:SAM-dependent methyltransferase
LQEDLKQLLSTSSGPVVRILDVGAGPLTTLGRHWEGHQIEIVAVDPLAEEYRALLKRLGISPPTETTLAHGEKLLEKFQPDQFDMAYSSNALDHSYDPVLAIGQMLKVVKPQGYVYLWHFANEGLTEAYQGLHQWNFDVRDNDFIIGDGRRHFSLAGEFGSSAKLQCERQFAYGKPVVIAKLRKL